MKVPEIVKDVKNKLTNNWFVNFFSTEDGKKRTLRRKRLTYILMAIFGVGFLLTQIQTVGINVTVRKSEFGAPNGALDLQGQTFEIPSAKGNPPTRSNRNQDRSRALGYGSQIIRRFDWSQVPPGTVFKAKLRTGASNGNVVADALDDVMVDDVIVIPKGTRFVGTGSSTEDRLGIQFNQAIEDGGTVRKIKAVALDASDHIVGLKGSQVGKAAWKIAGSVGLGFLGGMSQGLQDSQVSPYGDVTPPTLKNAMLRGAAQSALDQSKELIQQSRDQQPRIEVPVGTELFILYDSLQPN